MAATDASAASSVRVHDWAQGLLLGTALTDKLAWPAVLEDAAPGPAQRAPEAPGRPAAWAFTPQRAPFPSRAALQEDLQRGRMLHFFANHELLAIEIFALALLRFPNAPPRFRQGLVRTIRDEQLHFSLYLTRMAELGVMPGAVPVNRFFWDCAADLTDPIDLCVRMGLVFEQANLDFCVEFGQTMVKVGDHQTGAILHRVLTDELGHVQLGLHWFRQWKDPAVTDWDAFVARLHLPLSPTRARGRSVDRGLRQRAGFDQDFIDRLAVHGASKGRPPTVWLFNPDTEAELLDPDHKSSPKVARLSRDLAALPWVLARREDLVLVDPPPRLAWLQHLQGTGLTLPEFAAEVGPRKVGALSPWGWSPHARARLAALAERSLVPPPQPLAAAFGKDTAADLLAAWWPERAFLGGTRCQSWSEVQAAVRALEPQRAAIKSVLSTAGRGILHQVERTAVEHLLKSQPAVMVVPWLERELDLSMHLDIGAASDPATARGRGFTVFDADKRGQWRRSLAARPEAVLNADMLRFLHGQHPRGLPGLGKELGDFLAPRLAALGVRGPVGVDMLVGRDATGQRLLHPLVELNPRWTMGRVALALRPRVAPRRSAWLSLVPGTKAAVGGAALEPVQLDPAGRLQAGRLWLTDPLGARFAAVLDVGAASSEA